VANGNDPNLIFEIEFVVGCSEAELACEGVAPRAKTHRSLKG